MTMIIIKICHPCCYFTHTLQFENLNQFYLNNSVKNEVIFTMWHYTSVVYALMSICLSVSLSRARGSTKTAKHITLQRTSHGSLRIRVFWRQRSWWNSNKGHANEVPNIHRVWKLLTNISLYLRNSTRYRLQSASAPLYTLLSFYSQIIYHPNV